MAGDVCRGREALLAREKATPLIRQALRTVLAGKLLAERFEINGQRGYRFSRRLTIERLLSGEALPGQFLPERCGFQITGSALVA